MFNLFLVLYFEFRHSWWHSAWRHCKWRYILLPLNNLYEHKSRRQCVKCQFVNVSRCHQRAVLRTLKLFFWNPKRDALYKSSLSTCHTYQRWLINDFLAIHLGWIIIVRARSEFCIYVLVAKCLLQIQMSGPFNPWIGSAALHIPLQRLLEMSLFWTRGVWGKY